MWANTNHKTWIGNGGAGAGVRLGDRMRSSQGVLSARDTLRREERNSGTEMVGRNDLSSPKHRQKTGVGPWAGSFLIPSRIWRGSELVTHLSVFPALIPSGQDLEGWRRANSTMGNTQETQPVQMISKHWPSAFCHSVLHCPVCIHACVCRRLLRRGLM